MPSACSACVHCSTCRGSNRPPPVPSQAQHRSGERPHRAGAPKGDPLPEDRSGVLALGGRAGELRAPEARASQGGGGGFWRLKVTSYSWNQPTTAKPPPVLIKTGVKRRLESYRTSRIILSEGLPGVWTWEVTSRQKALEGWRGIWNDQYSPVASTLLLIN